MKIWSHKIWRVFEIKGEISGKHYLVVKKDNGFFYSMKLMPKKKEKNIEEEQKVQRERDIHSQLKNPFLVRL